MRKSNIVIKPSDLQNPKTYSTVKKDCIEGYLIHKNWRLIDKDEKGIDWYWHSKRPTFGKNDFREEGYNTACLIPRTIANSVEDERFLVSVVPENFGDYNTMVGWLLEDLERQEDRWRGFILQDILEIV